MYDVTIVLIVHDCSYYSRQHISLHTTQVSRVVGHTVAHGDEAISSSATCDESLATHYKLPQKQGDRVALKCYKYVCFYDKCCKHLQYSALNWPRIHTHYRKNPHGYRFTLAFPTC